MHHRKTNLRKLNCKGSHRLAIFRNITISLINHEVIKTTLKKAKMLRMIIEPLITIAKVDTVANRRLIFSRIRNNKIVTKLFKEIGPHFTKRAGGYTRIIKCGFRTGDNAPMAYILLINRCKTENKK